MASCYNQKTTSITIPSPDQTTADTKQNPKTTFLDSSIFVSNNAASSKSYIAISDSVAQTILYDYFRTKGVIPRKELLIRSTIKTDEASVDYDTIYQIKSGTLTGAVITYWLGPFDLNGQCFQQNKALILNTKNGYMITNFDFIASRFIIDSTKGAAIYGYEYECGGRGIIRQFRIDLR